jgi:uncharacterized phiE125 gp8 family phage protein
MIQPHYSLSLVTGPAVEPITTAQAKAQSRVNISDDDTYIDTLIAAARLYTENKFGLRLISQTWTLRLDGFPGSAGCIEIPYGPVSAISSVKYVNTSEVLTTIDPTEYAYDLHSIIARLYPAYSLVWPVSLPMPNSVQIEYVTGYADAAALAVARPNIVLAVKMMVDHWYEVRSPVMAGTIVSEVPKTVDDLLNAERASWL